MTLLLLLACIEDDYDPNDTGKAGGGDDTAGDETGDSDSGGDSSYDTGDDTGGGLAIVGDWVSEGDDISPLLAEYGDVVRVDATFGANGSLVATALDGDGESTEYVSTYDAVAGSPGAITVTQTSPYAATSEGIWQVEGDVLTYEVIQVTPDYGYSPATPESGFGSTSGPYLEEGDNVQVYRRP